MSLSIGNAPCSWGVEFADAVSNPPWETVIQEASRAGYQGIELGPVGYMPEDPDQLRDSLQSNGLTLIGGVVFQAFHDPDAWKELLEAHHRTCHMLELLNARHLVLITSVADARKQYSGQPDLAPRLENTQIAAMHERIRTAAKIANEQYGLSVSMHAHAGGFIEFEDELEQVLHTVDENILKLCLDSGHCLYSDYDPVALFKRYSDRVDYLHLKDINPTVLQYVRENRIGFYDACERGVFCNLGEGAVDFTGLLQEIQKVGYNGWATVEQDRGPNSHRSVYEDAVNNMNFLKSSNFTN